MVTGPVEAVIALSIVFVAMEIARTHQGRQGLAESQPWIVAFAFRLLHGFGFAGAFAQLDLPENDPGERYVRPSSRHGRVLQ